MLSFCPFPFCHFLWNIQSYPVLGQITFSQQNHILHTLCTFSYHKHILHTLFIFLFFYIIFSSFIYIVDKNF